MTNSTASVSHWFLHSGWSLLAAMLIGALAGPLQAETWTGTLQDGSVLKVDPSSRRPMHFYNGGTAPLWDGTHRLENGSIVIVRDGQVVPTESMMSTWSSEPEAQAGLTQRYCEQLVRKACGFNDECARSEHCAKARQLLTAEREERGVAGPDSGPSPQTPGGIKCQEGLASAAFPVCASSLESAEPTPCKKLVESVCGPAQECESGKACNPAHQLLQMETEERLQAADPMARTSTGAECAQAMDKEFFAPCRSAELSQQVPQAIEGKPASAIAISPSSHATSSSLPAK